MYNQLFLASIKNMYRPWMRTLLRSIFIALNLEFFLKNREKLQKLKDSAIVKALPALTVMDS